MSTKAKQHKLPELIAYYETCNRAEGKSPKTIEWYSANLHMFHAYIRDRHISDSLESMTIRLLREYVLYLLKRVRYERHPFTPAKDEQLSPATIHAYVRTLRAFFSWIVGEGLAESHIAQDLKPPKLPRKVISTLTDEEIRVILASFDTRNPIDARNQAIVMLLLDSGLRIAELANLATDDVHLNEGYIKVLGKGKKERIVPFGSSVQKAIQRYLFKDRTKAAREGINNVFLSVQGYRLTENSIKLMFARLAQRTGVQRLHAHLCRHTFATRFLVNGGDVFSLQQILGHSTLEMVRHYVNLASNHVMIQHNKFSPLDRLNLR